MVLLNYWGAETGQSQPEYGGVSSSVFMQNFYKYASDDGYPVVAVLRPDGTKYKGWGDSTNPGTRGSILHQYIRSAIADLAPKSIASTVFDLAAESGNTVSVQYSGTTIQPGVWRGVVSRSGESGDTGSIEIALSGANANRYSLSATSLAWDGNDGSKSFTVTGPVSSDGGLVSDTITVQITASGFGESEVSYGVSSQEVTFKDSRVKQSLSEFAAANAGLQGLAAASGTWFVPATGANVLATLTGSSSALEFTATVGGVLTVGVGGDNPGIIEASANGATHELVANQPIRFGVSAGEKIVLKATARTGAAEAVSIGFTEFSFAPLSVSLVAPANGVQVSYAEMKADKAKVDMRWTASLGGCTFAVECGGVAKDVGSATSVNALDLGFVSQDPVTKSYTWRVTAAYSAADLYGIAKGTASATFTVAAMPTFDNLPATIEAYKSIDVKIDLVAGTSDAGTVTYSAVGLPSGMKINKNTGAITGSPRRVGSKDVTVTAKSEYGEATKSFKISVGNLQKSYTKPTYACFCFSDAGDIEAVVEVKIKTSGKWTAKITDAGSTSKLSGQLTSRKDGTIAISSGSRLDIAFNFSSKMWTGSSSGHRVYGKAVDKADGTWKGTWNSGVAASASASLGGWVTAKVSGSGQVKFSGTIANQKKVSGKGYSAVFPASFVAANLPKWAGHGNVRFAYMGKVDGGYALCSDGTCGGRFVLQSVVFDEIEGSKWSGESIAALNGASFMETSGGNVVIPIAVSGGKMSAAKNGYGAKISATQKSGRVKASYSNGAKCKASGVIYFVGRALKAAGGGSSGARAFTFVIE